MKKIKGAIILLTLIAATAVSCKKDDDNNVDNPTGGSATVTASNYGFDGTGGAEFKSTAAGMVKVGTIFTLTAIKDGTNQSITIILPKVGATGKYDLLEGNADGNGAIMSKDYKSPADGTLNYTTDAVVAAGMRGGGEVNFTKLTATEAEGTFYIIAHNSAGKEAFVESGKFTGKITAQ
jgi:hypothetical protein